MTGHVPSQSSVVTYHVGPGWVRELKLQAQDHVMGHIRFIRGALDSGNARLAGPFARLDERVEGEIVGMIVFDLPVNEALALVAEDPAVVHGLLVPEGHEFYPVTASPARQPAGSTPPGIGAAGS